MKVILLALPNQLGKLVGLEGAEHDVHTMYTHGKAVDCHLPTRRLICASDHSCFGLKGENSSMNGELGLSLNLHDLISDLRSCDEAGFIRGGSRCRSFSASIDTCLACSSSAPTSLGPDKPSMSKRSLRFGELEGGLERCNIWIWLRFVHLAQCPRIWLLPQRTQLCKGFRS